MRIFGGPIPSPNGHIYTENVFYDCAFTVANITSKFRNPQKAHVPLCGVLGYTYIIELSINTKEKDNGY